MSEQQVWARKSTFIFAAAGSAIGLGNLWKFPYMVGENGGGAFVLIYLACVLLVGLPVMMSESIIGKYSKGNAIEALSATALRSNASQNWKAAGVLGMFGMFLILSFYSVIAGWAFDYTYNFAAGTFDGKTVGEMGAFFDGLLGDPSRLIMWHTIFMVLTAIIISLGATDGIEKSLGIMMPILFILLIGVVIYSMVATGKFAHTLNYMFSADFTKITPMVVINALGQAFFSLSLGMCVIMTYASYMRDDVSITESSVYITALDTGMALLAGLAIFPIVFANGMDVGAGPGLLFVTLSTAFAQLGTVGTILGFAFFFMVILAALSSSISMVEPFVKWCQERFGVHRVVSTVLYCIAVWGLGIITVLSFNVWKEVDFLGTGKTPFDVIDFVTSSIILPLGGLLVALYAGWGLSSKISREQLSSLGNVAFSLWLFIVRFVAPVLIAIVFVSSVLGEEKMTKLVSDIMSFVK